MGKIIMIKMGGKFTADEENLLNLAADMKAMGEEYSFIVVHGGGAEVTALSRKFDIEPVFKNGIRVTTKDEMTIVDKVLSGKINKRLVRLFQKAGFNAVGLTGSDGRIFTGISLEKGNQNPSHTGVIDKVDPRLLTLLLSEAFLPVVGSTSMDMDGMALNINADDAAFAVAGALSSDTAVFLSDIPGILKDGAVIRKITVKEIEEEVKAGVITGGMIPKVKSTMQALENGVKQIIIGQYTGKGELKKLIDGTAGTHIVASR